LTGIEAVGVAFIGALVAIFFFIVHLSLPKEKDWITEAEEETHRIEREIEMLKSREFFANAAYSIGKTNVHTKPSKPTTDTNVTACGKKRCAYCDTLNDHETGVCDRCGAPLL
jgi:hypothetical protein